MSIDVVGDFLTIIRNGLFVAKKNVTIPYSKFKHQIAGILKDEGFIKDLAVQQDEKGRDQLKLFLKYVDGESAIHEIKRISKPGRRIYKGFTQIEPVVGGLGISILSTSKGLLNNKQAKELKVGGEVLCTVW